MADGKELKPRSFRLNDETAEKFKEIAATIDGNQQETLAKLIEAYEFQSSKNILGEKKAEIEQFERYISAIVGMYMGRLEDNQNLAETIRTEFDALLRSKDTTIQDLQEKLAVTKQLKEESTERAKAHAEENVRLTNSMEKMNREHDAKLESMQTMLFDKEKLNQALADTCADLKAKVENMSEAAEHAAQLKAQYDSLLQERSDIGKELDELKKQLQQAQAAHEESLERQKELAQISHDKALIGLERKYEEQIQKLKIEKQTEIDKYQQKYFDLLEQLNKAPQ